MDRDVRQSMIGEREFLRGGTDGTCLERQMTDIVAVANNFLFDQQEYKQNKEDQKQFLYRRKARHCSNQGELFN